MKHSCLFHEIEIHDFEFTGFNYNYQSNMISMQCDNIFSHQRYKLQFLNVYYLEGQACCFWGGGNSIMSMYEVDISPYISKLIDIQEKQNEISAGIAYDMLKGYGWYLNSGDEFVILCEEISVTLEDLPDEAAEQEFAIKEIISFLKSDDIELQTEGLERGIRCDKIMDFIQPIYEDEKNESFLRNCARVVIHRSDFQLKAYMMFLMYWISDYEKAGAGIIFNRLLQYNDIETLSYWIEVYTEEAVKKADYKSICGISEFLDRNEVVEKLTCKTRNALQQNRISLIWDHNILQ